MNIRIAYEHTDSFVTYPRVDNRLFAFWGVGVVFEASRGLWTVSWDDDRTQELASGASSTKTRTQFGYPNFVQHPKTLQFQRCDFNV